MDDINFSVGSMLIDGKLVESRDGGWLTSTNPAGESFLGKAPAGSKRDVDEAVDAAARAFPAWAALSMERRAQYVNALADAILAKTEEFARVEALDTGNTIGPMRADVTTAVDRMRFAAGLAYEIKGETVPATPGNIHMTLRVPYGVVGRIIPFNHPIGFAASRIAPAIITGNTMVIKPSGQSPLSASILARLCARILPPGVVNVVTGGRDTGEALVRHPKVKRIAFIGSAASGMAIQKAAAETSVKHVTLEPGGKNPLVAFPDSDLDRVAAASVGKFGLGSLASLGKLLIGFYITCLVFVFGVLGPVCRMADFSLFKLLRYIREELLICYATTSSETVLPRMISKMENLGCERGVVGLVIPTGYSFNLDGTCLYLATTSVFLAQATNTPLDIAQQVGLMAILLLTAKGAAGIAGAAFVVLAATLSTHGSIPVASVALVLGIHRLMSQGLTPTNLIGNAVATIVIAKWEKSCDDKLLQSVLNGR